MDAVDVLQKHVPRTAIGGDADKLKEQAAAFAVKAVAATGQAKVLAREATHNAIHCAMPCCCVESGNVGPDRCVIQALILAARCQDAGGVCFPLNVADGASLDAQVGEPGSQSFTKHADAGKAFDGM
jgi:hypothetical protein